MNITFFIGNGFDINLGLKTRYTDFLSEYLKTKHDDALSKAIEKDFDTWADLETQLGIYAGSVKENEVEQFFVDNDALENALIEYLGNLTIPDLIISPEGVGEFQRMITQFWKYLPAVERDHYESVLANTREVIRYRIIDFNYTRYLDDLCEAAKGLDPFSSHTTSVGNRYNDEIFFPIHIHGEIDGELILGVNDKSQIGSGDGEPLAAITEYLIKPNVNRKLGNQKTKQVQNIIDKSKYVCVFGMSLGITDKLWWEYLGEWLEQSPDRRLILFMYDNSGWFFSGRQRTRKEDSIRNGFIDMIGKKEKSEQLSSQIVVVLNSGIFTFDIIKLEKTEDVVNE